MNKLFQAIHSNRLKISRFLRPLLSPNNSFQTQLNLLRSQFHLLKASDYCSMEEKKEREEALRSRFAALLRQQHAAGHFDEALLCWDQFLEFQFQPSREDFHVAMKSSSSSRDQSVALLQQMKQQGIAPTHEIFQIYLDGCARWEDPTLARFFFQQICQSGLTPNDSEWASLFRCFGTSGDFASLREYESFFFDQCMKNSRRNCSRSPVEQWIRPAFGDPPSFSAPQHAFASTLEPNSSSASEDPSALIRTLVQCRVSTERLSLPAQVLAHIAVGQVKPQRQSFLSSCRASFDLFCTLFCFIAGPCCLFFRSCA